MTGGVPIALRALDDDQVGALVSGRRLPGWHGSYPTAEDVMIARLWDEGRWLPAPWQVVDLGLVVGTIGTKGPAGGDAAEAEISYGLVDGARGHGVGTAMLTLALERLTALGLTRVVAHTDADNAANLRMLLRAGFSVIGENADEVLLALRLERPEPEEA